MSWNKLSITPTSNDGLVDIGHIVEGINQLTTQLHRRRAVAERLTQQRTKAEATIAVLEKEKELEQKAHGVLLGLEAVWRKDFERGIEELVSEALRLIFRSELEFKINVSVKAGVSAIDFTLKSPYGETPIMDADGGSVVEVVSFLLRVIMIKASRPPLAPVIILDEAFKGVDDANMPQVAELLRRVVDDSGIQIIMVTHDKRYTEVADQVLEVRNKDGVGTVHVH